MWAGELEPSRSMASLASSPGRAVSIVADVRVAARWREVKEDDEEAVLVRLVCSATRAARHLAVSIKR